MALLLPDQVLDGGGFPRRPAQEPAPTLRFLVKGFRGWVLRSTGGRTLYEGQDLFTLLNFLPRPAEGSGRHYLITSETQVLVHEHLIQRATGWVTTAPFNLRLHDQLLDHTIAARKVLAASDASLLGPSKGAVAYTIFDGQTLTLGGYSTVLRQSRQCSFPGIDRLETIAALEAARAVHSLIPHARVVLGTDSRSAQSMLLEFPEMTAAQVGAHLQETTCPADLSPAHPLRQEKAAQRIREQLQDRHLRPTWVRSHTLNEESKQARNLTELRALPEQIIMRELNVLADQTARVLNSTPTGGRKPSGASARASSPPSPRPASPGPRSPTASEQQKSRRSALFTGSERRELISVLPSFSPAF